MVNAYSSHLFDQVKSVITKKQKFDRDYIESHYIGSFMMRRWLSFVFKKYTPDYFRYINTVMNNHHFGDNYQDYLYLYNTFPTGLSGYTFKGAYIKKISKPPTKKETQAVNIVEVLSQGLDISKKDAKLLVEQENFDKELFREIFTEK